MTDTIIAQSTPSGQSALALLRISGTLCPQIAAEALALPYPTPRTSYLRDYLDGESHEMLDQVLVVFFGEGNSFTGEPTLEISCHGNELIVAKIIQDLIRRGCRIALPGEFSKRAFLSGRIDLTQAESIAELISAKSEAELKIARFNLKGMLSRRFADLQDAILDLQAKLEASIDFPEDDIDEENKDNLLLSLESILAEINRMISSSTKKTTLSNALKVVLIGSPNAGKSTLFNGILGQHRAIVSDSPGTTRDYISKELTIGEFRVELIDCAGIRKAETDTEKQGVDMALELLDEASVILLVIDRSVPYPTELNEMIIDRLRDKKVILIENKADLPPAPSSLDNPAIQDNITLCAHDESDLSRLSDQVLTRLSSIYPQDPSKDLIVNERHSALLKQAAAHLTEALQRLSSTDGHEIVLQELNLSREYLDEIIGLKTNEDVLDKLFGQFCIGK